jgi:hypothetical protein
MHESNVAMLSTTARAEVYVVACKNRGPVAINSVGHHLLCCNVSLLVIQRTMLASQTQRNAAEKRYHIGHEQKNWFEA